LQRLHACNLIHRWHDLAVAAHAAVRFHEITHGCAGTSPGDREERHWDRAVLKSLLARSGESEAPPTPQQLYEAFGATDTRKRVDIDDALVRLDGAGLIERHDGRSIPSNVARRLDELLTV
jgi:hypothetical protein